MIENRSLKHQFWIASALVLGLSLLLSALTYGLMILWWINGGEGELYPANYYEKKLPEIHAYTMKYGADLLNPHQRENLEAVIPLEGMTYQVMDDQGRICYGTIQRQLFSNRESVMNRINSHDIHGQVVTKYYPLLGTHGDIQGAIALRYAIRVSSANPRRPFVGIVVFILFASPFFYLIFMMVLVGRRFSKSLIRPVQELIEASRRIQQRDLNFTLEYHSKNELGQLVNAFEEMRSSLRDSLLREWKLEEERKEMVAAIAHDLRTPLTIIRGHVEHLLDGGAGKPERLDSYLRTIEQNTERVIHLVEEMQQATEVDQMDFTITREPVDLAMYIRDKARDYDSLVERKGIRLAVEMMDQREEEQKGPVLMDSYRVTQILDNVMANSIRFTPEGGLIQWYTEIEKETVRFTICDNGPGFAKKDVAKLFQKFYQGDQTRSQEKGHAGLGLYIAQVLAEKHGGTITAENGHNGGACICVMIRVR